MIFDPVTNDLLILAGQGLPDDLTFQRFTPARVLSTFGDRRPIKSGQRLARSLTGQLAVSDGASVDLFDPNGFFVSSFGTLNANTVKDMSFDPATGDLLILAGDSSPTDDRMFQKFTPDGVLSAFGAQRRDLPDARLALSPDGGWAVGEGNTIDFFDNAGFNIFSFRTLDSVQESGSHSNPVRDLMFDLLVF